MLLVCSTGNLVDWIFIKSSHLAVLVSKQLPIECRVCVRQVLNLYVVQRIFYLEMQYVNAISKNKNSLVVTNKILSRAVSLTTMHPSQRYNSIKMMRQPHVEKRGEQIKKIREMVNGTNLAKVESYHTDELGDFQPRSD